MKKILLLILVFQALISKPHNSFAQTTVADTALTFMLSNEAPGYLIDNLIASGYGDSSIYAVMQYLQPLSGGAIPQWLMDSLAVCPANSDVFTGKLNSFSDPSNNPVGIGDDGFIIISGIYGRDWSGKAGYTTYYDSVALMSLKLFTKAIGPPYYIDAGTRTYYDSSGSRITTNYTAFAIAWSLGSTFVLSNEGGLIDDLIRAGHGDKNMVQVLQLLQPASGGIIQDDFIKQLATCPVDSDVLTAALSNFSNAANNPICINSDGTMHVASIYGKDYFQNTGYSTLPENPPGFTAQLFTYAASPNNYINVGSGGPSGGTTIYYKAFAIAWKASTTFVLSNEGGLIDDLIRAGYGTKNLYQTLDLLKPKSGGVISDEFMATLANCPAGSEIFTAALSNFAGLNNPVCINTDGTLKIKPIFGKDYLLKDGYSTLPLNQNGYTPELFTVANSAENYIDAGHSSGQSRYNAFGIAWKASTTFVLSNEGGLIDDLIRAGHGTKNLFQTLEVLKPKSGGVISDEFMATLAKCPTGSEIFTAALSNFSVNYPVCINSDGTILINPIYGKDYFRKEGYSTLPLNQNGYTSELFTVANSSENYIDGGSSDSSEGTKIYYKAFAIAWKASTTFVLSNEGGLIDDLIRAGHGDKNLYQTLEVLKPKSGGVISDEFMVALANCPAGSEIFTAALTNFSVNYPVCINSDGTISINPIYGRDYFRKDGYTTLPLNQDGYTSALFTVANSEENYVNAGVKTVVPIITYYKAFAIAWKASTTFVLSNEGGLIDDLIAAGYGSGSPYDALLTLQSASGGVISDEFLDKLATCPAGSDIFTAPLSNFAGLNNPVCINTDGTLGIRPIFARDYYGKEGYATYPETQTGVGRELFTYTINPDYYIDAGSSNVSGSITYYKAFAIGWSMNTPTTFVLSNEEGGLIDELIAAGYGSGSLYEVLLDLQGSSGGVISDAFMDTLADTPSGSQIFTQKLNNYANLNGAVCINTDGTVFTTTGIKGRDYYGNTGYSTYPTAVGARESFTYANDGSYYIDAVNGGTTYKVFAIAWSNSTNGIPMAETNQGAPYAYPNPFADGFYVQNLPEIARLEIFDIRGKLVYRTEPKDNKMVQPWQLTDGIYFLKLINSQGTRYQKIVKY